MIQVSVLDPFGADPFLILTLRIQCNQQPENSRILSRSRVSRELDVTYQINGAVPISHLYMFIPFLCGGWRKEFLEGGWKCWRKVPQLQVSFCSCFWRGGRLPQSFQASSAQILTEFMRSSIFPGTPFENSLRKPAFLGARWVYNFGRDPKLGHDTMKTKIIFGPVPLK